MLNLITDRTGYDVSRYLELRNKGFANMTTAERTEWLAGMKGSYNASDLNRVGEALNYVKSRLGLLGYTVSFSAKTDWSASDTPTAAEIKYYLDCVKQVRGAVAVLRTTPAAPVYSGALNYQEANAIEKILTDVDMLLDYILAALFYCNDLYSGEV